MYCLRETFLFNINALWKNQFKKTNRRVLRDLQWTSADSTFYMKDHSHWKG